MGAMEEKLPEQVGNMVHAYGKMQRVVDIEMKEGLSKGQADKRKTKIWLIGRS